MKHGFVQTAKHGRMHYLEQGSGPVLVLLHSKAMWFPTAGLTTLRWASNMSL